MPRASQFATAVTALLLLGTAFPVLLAAAERSQAEAPSAQCEEALGVSILPAPVTPWKGAPLRVFLVTEKPSDGELSLIAPNGSVAAKAARRYGQAPYIWYAEVPSPAAGTWHVQLNRSGAAECGTISHEIAVKDAEPPRPHNSEGSVWPIHKSWTRATENLYSAWIEKMFDAPMDAAPSWPALHEVLRDKSRNALHNYLGYGEDQSGMVVRPDCADLPYFLRAYFAFKMGLPFGYSKCNRGGGGQPPRCGAWFNIQNPEDPQAREEAEKKAAPIPQPQSGGFFGAFREPVVQPVSKPAPPKNLGLVPSFGRYLPVLADGVHSGSARTALNDDNTDYYPVPLSQDTLRPGTIYADPYGHVLMLVKRVPQMDGASGVFFAVDGQPDGTVARKRFWRGNFLFAQDPGLGGPGFKRFRPIVSNGGSERRLANAEIAKNPQYGDFSLEQAKLSVEDFYDRMDEVMSPEPLDPMRAMMAVIDALEEQVKARVTSVENGRKWQLSGKSDAEMPEGWTIFEAAGAWEDFATPSRDLRLLIAIDVVRGFPARVARRSERYAMPAGKSASEVKAELDRVLASELASRKFSYLRTDGSAWTLALQDVVSRAGELEMAYNLNDCVELRWGAQPGGEEAATCKRHAPAGQRGKMSQYREWFHDRRRPARGAG
jgi:hypothetical protein